MLIATLQLLDMPVPYSLMLVRLNADAKLKKLHQCPSLAALLARDGVV